MGAFTPVKPVYTVGSTVQWEIERGDSASFSATAVTLPSHTPVDLTGYTPSLLDSDDIDIPATVTIPDPTTGLVLVVMTGIQTAALTDKFFRLRIAQTPSATYTLLEGRINVS